MKFCPRSVETLYDDWMAPNVHLSNSFRMYIIAGFVWAMWCNRNKMAIEKKSEQLKMILYGFISYMQRWELMLKPKDQVKLKKMLDSLNNWLQEPGSGGGVITEEVI